MGARKTNVDKDSKKRLDDQTPAKGKYLLMQSHLPPTMDDSAPVQPGFDLITHFDDVTHRMCWINLLYPWILRGERWQALSTTADGKTLYESREVFGGLGGYIIRLLFGTKLMMSFNAMADALKARAEQM